MAALSEATFNLSGIDEPIRVRGMSVTANLFQLMGLDIVRGRGFLHEEELPNGPRVAVLSHGAWTRRFGSDPNIVGREVLLNEEIVTVVGILTPDLEVGYFTDIEVWTPLSLQANHGPRDQRRLAVWARLSSTTTPEEAQAEVAAIAQRLEDQYPSTNSGWTATVVGFPDWIMGENSRTVLFLFAITVAFVMLIACSNVAGLLLARAGARARELAVRTALGAQRRRIVRQLMTESLVLSIAGGALGLLLSHWAFVLLVNITRSREPVFEDLHIDGSVLVFTLVLAMLTPLVFGLFPAIRATRTDISEELKEGGGRSGSGFSRQKLRRMLVTTEVSLALILLIVTGLLVRSQYELIDLELGFDPDDVMTWQMDLPSSKYSEEHQVRAFFDAVLEKTQALPDVRSAGFISHRPIIGGEPNQTFTIAGRPTPEPGEMPIAATITATPEAFDVLRIPLLQGRLFEESDAQNSPLVALISRTSATRYWPDTNPAGEQIRLGSKSSDASWIEIVGVVGDIRNPDADQPPEPHIYLPQSQHPQVSMALVARIATEPLSITSAVRRVVWDIDPHLPVYDARTMRQILFDDFATSYALFSLLSYFSLVALGLATAGIYGVVSYAVSQRSHEIGIRIALGARTSDVLKMLLRQGLVPVALGVLIGLAGALVLSNGLASLVYGITSTDPATFITVTMLLASMAFLAVIGPAVRAARCDPSSTLRHE
jgi:putative ABC transport system permease protein